MAGRSLPCCGRSRFVSSGAGADPPAIMDMAFQLALTLGTAAGGWTSAGGRPTSGLDPTGFGVAPEVLVLLNACNACALALAKLLPLPVEALVCLLPESSNRDCGVQTPSGAAAAPVLLLLASAAAAGGGFEDAASSMACRASREHSMVSGSSLAVTASPPSRSSSSRIWGHTMMSVHWEPVSPCTVKAATCATRRERQIRLRSPSTSKIQKRF